MDLRLPLAYLLQILFCFRHLPIVEHHVARMAKNTPTAVILTAFPSAGSVEDLMPVKLPAGPSADVAFICVKQRWRITVAVYLFTVFVRHNTDGINSLSFLSVFLLPPELLKPFFSHVRTVAFQSFIGFLPTFQPLPS